MSAKVFSNKPEVDLKAHMHAAKGIENGVKKLKAIARPRTGFDTGDLSDPATMTEALGLKGQVMWTEPYAQYQERGSRADGLRQIKNRPGGGQSHFAQESAEELPDYNSTIFGHS